MEFMKKVVIAVPLSEKMSQMLMSVREMEFLKDSDIHLVSVLNTMTYTVGMGDYPLIYPLMEDRRALEESITKKLTATAREILPKSAAEKVQVHCLFGDNPKERFCSFLEEVNADSVIVAMRKKRDFFESSFTQYVTKHTRANILILKDHS